ncbi:MAG: response regulator [Alphaproteobacteria bacterium]|uniref:response regulator n=1 Tax=Brevundimonas sp. TaxID=1871086 RepID=UPI0025BE1602|nr:response regulator [Brevundimonas sp.]MBU3971191.1 response regulator [Alphaproteobacteria bacterium]
MPRGRYRIMVVDSQPAMRMMICSQLRGLGYGVLTCAHDGASALVRLKTEPVDAVLMDVETTGTGGLEALVALRADPALRHLPVVVITTRAERETVEASLALGVSGYLIKPPKGAALGACLGRALLNAHDPGRTTAVPPAA